MRKLPLHLVLVLSLLIPMSVLAQEDYEQPVTTETGSGRVYTTLRPELLQQALDTLFANTTGGSSNEGIALAMTITATEVHDGGASPDAELSLTFTSPASTADFDETDITVRNGAITGFAGSGRTYTATFTPSGAGYCTIDVPAGSFTDDAGNDNVDSDQFFWMYIDLPPTMTISATEVSDGDSSNDGSLSLTFTASEAIADFTSSDITVTNGSISSFSGSGATYTATFIPTGDGPCTIMVDAAAFSDVTGNDNEATNAFSWTHEFLCGTTAVAYHEDSYPTVLIGDQCLFKENLRSDQYANGAEIPYFAGVNEWGGTSAGAQVLYQNYEPHLATRGRLYNWYAVNDARGLCPSGWHVPSDAEWTTLTDHLGANAGAKMKNSSEDTPAWNGTNSSGFSGVSGGFRGYGGQWHNGGTNGYWWSSTANGGTAWARVLRSDSDDAIRMDDFFYHRNGFSVRCLRD